MTTIDYKEKYEQAMERARQFIEKPYLEDSAGIVEFIFPELKESEDERIRKELIDFVKSRLAGFPQCEKFIAWLEKQGELVNSLSKGLDNAHKRIDELIQKNNELCIKLEKQGEQKPADVRTTGYWHVEDIKQKPAWSEEDETALNDIIMCGERHCYLDAENIAWLKNLKNHVQPQNSNITDEKLAQAKKDAYNDALDKIEYHSGEPTFDDGWSAAIDYIQKKSFRLNLQWKPSDEQIEVLVWCIPLFADPKSKGILESLINELKKLRED